MVQDMHVTVKGARLPTPFPDALSLKVLPHWMRSQIHHMIQLVHFFAAAYFVHVETFQISFWVIFYTLGRLLNNWSVLRMRPPLRSCMLGTQISYMLLVLG